MNKQQAFRNGQQKREMEAEFTRTFAGTLDPRVYVTLIGEEMREVEEAQLEGRTAHYLKELADLNYVLVGLHNRTQGNTHLLPKAELKLIQALMKEATSILYEGYEAFSSEVIHEAFTRVHKSNMSKLGADGRPIYREDGKILKGPNYKEPNLFDLVS